MSKRPQHRRFLCKGCTHGLEHHPERGACRYGHSRADGGTSCGPAGEGSPAGGCRCPAFNTPKNRIPTADVGDVSARAAAGKARILGEVSDPAVASSETKAIVPGHRPVTVGDIGLALLHSAEILLGALRGFIDALSRGGAASISPPQVDAVRSRGRALETAPTVTTGGVATSRAPKVSPRKVASSTDCRPSTTPPPQGAIAGTADGKIVEYVDDETVRVTTGLGKSEETALILIAQSAAGLTQPPLRLALRLALRTIQNIIKALRAGDYIEKDGQRFTATDAGRLAIAGRYVEREKGAILEELGETTKRVLFAIASKPHGITLAALGVMVPSIAKRTRQNIVKELKTRELVTKDGDRFQLTDAALEELEGKLEPVLKGEPLRTKIRSELPEGEAYVFGLLEAERHQGLPMRSLQDLTYERYALRTLQNIVKALKARELVRKDGDVLVLASELFS